MSVKVEWMTTRHLSVEVVDEGERVGQHEVTAPHALVISGDEVTVVEGPKGELLAVLRAAERELDHR